MDRFRHLPRTDNPILPCPVSPGPPPPQAEEAIPPAQLAATVRNLLPMLARLTHLSELGPKSPILHADVELPITYEVGVASERVVIEWHGDSKGPSYHRAAKGLQGGPATPFSVGRAQSCSMAQGRSCMLVSGSARPWTRHTWLARW